MTDKKIPTAEVQKEITSYLDKLTSYAQVLVRSKYDDSFSLTTKQKCNFSRLVEKLPIPSTVLDIELLDFGPFLSISFNYDKSVLQGPDLPPSYLVSPTGHCVLPGGPYYIAQGLWSLDSFDEIGNHATQYPYRCKECRDRDSATSQ